MSRRARLRGYVAVRLMLRQVRVIKSVRGGPRTWWPGRYRSAFEALREAARYEGMSMHDFYGDAVTGERRA